MSASAESQERWNQYYQSASRTDQERKLIQTMDRRRIWYSVFMVCSSLFVVGLTTVFYNVLTR
jgi:hypothetical protein